MKVRFHAGELDHLGGETRWKYFVVLSLDTTTAEIHGAFFTSKVAEWRAVHFQDHLVTLSTADYTFLTMQSGITLYDLRAVDRASLRARYETQEVFFAGDLTEADLAAVDEVIRESRRIERGKKKLVLP